MRFISFLLCLAFSNAVVAHQPDLSSTILAEQENGEWILQVRSALTAFQYEVKYEYGDSSYTSKEQFGELVLEHLLNNLNVSFEGSQPMELTNGFVKIGHETNVLFKIKDVPDSFSTLQVANTGFSQIHNNQGALIVMKKGLKRKQFTLNSKNQHSASLLLEGEQLQLIEAGVSSGINYSIIDYGLLLAVLLTVFLLFRTQSKKVFDTVTTA